MIRKTLAATKAATFCIELPDQAREGMPTPRGTGFFVSRDGWFVTAGHVVMEGDQIRTDVQDAWLTKEMKVPTPGSGAWGSDFCQWPTLDFVDVDTDIALLKVDFDQNASKEWLKDKDGFPFIPASRRPLDEGEPVYSFGYPLPEAAFLKGKDVMVGLTKLAPRITSAIVSSCIESSRPVMTTDEPVVYVLDKALNYGNSGGPIVSTATGRAHAVCTRFQPVVVPQPHLRIGDQPVRVMVPSLYGIVASLGNPAILAALEQRGVQLAEG